METRWLGSHIPYQEALALQQELVVTRQQNKIPDTILLLEHTPVYTIGRIRDQSSLRDTTQLPHPVVEINRGGQATYHGPGQLVGYPILDLSTRGKDLHAYLRNLEEALIRTLSDFDVTASRKEGLTGVWIEERKIAALGIGVRKWVSMHGFALNITQESLQGFAHITPCGIDGVTTTCLHQESTKTPSVEETGTVVTTHLQSLLQAN